MESLNVEIRLRNIPPLAPIPKPSEEEMINEFKSLLLNTTVDNQQQMIKDYIQFLTCYGSGKLGRVLLYGIYPSSTYHQFDIKFQTKRIQNVFSRMMINNNEDDDHQHDSDSDDERQVNEKVAVETTVLAQHFESTFKNLVIFAKDSIQDTLYYAWNFTTGSNNSLESIYLVEVDETLSDVRPPTVVCDNLLEFLQVACLGNYIHDENLHSTKYLDAQQTENDNDDENDEEESAPIIERVFIPSLAVKVTSESSD